MIRWYAILALLVFFSCKNDKSAEIEETQVLETEIKTNDSDDSDLLYAKSRFRIRTDSSLSSKTVLTMSEGDTVKFLGDYSVSRPVIKLRGEYHYEPWLRVKHLKSGKDGWVYAAGLAYESDKLRNSLRAKGKYWEELNADDLEWEGTVPTGWGTATISDARDFKRFLIGFKQLIRSEDIDKVAELIRYPLKEIKTKQEFKNNYSRIITPQIMQSVREQRLDRIFRNDQGAMVGNGDIWFQQVGKSYKIIGINFKGRADIQNDLMNQLRRTYVDQTNTSRKIIAFPIRGFMEMRVEESSTFGSPKSMPLGKYSFVSSREGTHIFEREGSGGTRKAVFYMESDSSITLRVLDADETFELNNSEFKS